MIRLRLVLTERSIKLISRPGDEFRRLNPSPLSQATASSATGTHWQRSRSRGRRHQSKPDRSPHTRTSSLRTTPASGTRRTATCTPDVMGWREKDLFIDDSLTERVSDGQSRLGTASDRGVAHYQSKLFDLWRFLTGRGRQTVSHDEVFAGGKVALCRCIWQ